MRIKLQPSCVPSMFMMMKSMNGSVKPTALKIPILSLLREACRILLSVLRSSGISGGICINFRRNGLAPRNKEKIL